MKTNTFCRFLLSIVGFCICAFSFAFAAGPENDERTILSLEEGWAHAYVVDDTAYLEVVMSPGYVQTNVRGEVSTKAEEIAEVRDHAIHYERFESSDLKVRIYGDAAIVTGQTTIKATVAKSGRVIDASIRFTDTFVRHEGKWQAVAGQTTLLPAKP